MRVAALAWRVGVHQIAPAMGVDLPARSRKENDVKLNARVLTLVTACAAATACATKPEPPPEGADVAGVLHPLIPVPKDAIHAGLAWTEDMEPKICFGMRPSEYRGFDLVTDSGRLNPAFEKLVYGGFGFSEGAHGLDQATARSDLDRDNFVCWQLSHPDAFNDTGVFSIIGEDGQPQVSSDDFSLTEEAFTDAGDAAGLDYNIFCSGNVALPDGRWLFVGGHDKSGNNGIRKLNIFDPKTETWVDRGTPAVKQAFLEDPTGLEFPHPSALDEDNTDPPHESDMKYQRWYPSAVVLPDGDVLVLSGTDQDTSLGPPGTQFSPCSSRSDNAACSKVRYATPEIYDTQADRTLALENARKLFNMYPRSFVVQTGAGPNDWRVAVMGEVDDRFLDQRTKEPPLEIIGQYDPFTYTGRTYYLDVRAARLDPDRHVPKEDHWELVATAATAHDSGASAQLWDLDRHGNAFAQRVVLFGGNCGRTPERGPAIDCPEDIVEMIDFSAPTPTWTKQESLIKPASQNNAVALPNGEVLIVGGTVGRGPWDNTLELQIFDPNTGKIRVAHDIAVPHHDHSTTALLPDGRVAIMGGNATDLAGDVEHVDDGIPVVQIYDPPYLYRGVKPNIKQAPAEIHYGETFEIEVDNSYNVDQVVLIRPGPVTHNWDWGNRRVQLWHQADDTNRIRVQAPSMPGLAVPGYYMMFVVSPDGHPGKARLVQISAGD